MIWPHRNKFRCKYKLRRWEVRPDLLHNFSVRRRPSERSVGFHGADYLQPHTLLAPLGKIANPHQRGKCRWAASHIKRHHGIIKQSTGQWGNLIWQFATQRQGVHVQPRQNLLLGWQIWAEKCSQTFSGIHLKTQVRHILIYYYFIYDLFITNYY